MVIQLTNGTNLNYIIMLQLLIMVLSCFGLLIHAKLTENKERFTFLDYSLFIIFLCGIFIPLIDLLIFNF